jgi:ADP-heptose:LPS heptosyltransferase
LLLAAKPTWLMAFAHEQVPESLSGPRWRAGEHEVVRWCRMLCESGVRCDPGELQLDRPKVPLPPNAPGATVIHPGASSEARRWPLRRWAAVAAAERIVGRRVLLTGTAAERPLARAVAEAAGLPPEAVLAGRTTVDELAGVVAAAGRVVCGDTGIGHLATALGTSSLLLFGPVSPAEWGPPVLVGSRHRVLWAGGSGDPHGESPDPGLLRITVAGVLDALEALPA